MTTFTPVNTAEVTEALRAQIDNAPGLESVTVERSEVPAEDPSQCPRVGVYRVRTRFPSRTIGMGTGFRGQHLELIVMVTETGRDGPACEDALELLVQRVVAALLNDTSIGGLAQNLDDIEVRYDDYARTEAGVFMQRAVIFVTAVGMVQAA